MAHLTIESPRAILDLTLMLQRRHPRSAVRPFVLGVAGDRISHPGDARATASSYDTTATIVPGLAHMMMLEREWETVAQPLLAWLEKDFALTAKG